MPQTSQREPLEVNQRRGDPNYLYHVCPEGPIRRDHGNVGRMRGDPEYRCCIRLRERSIQWVVGI